MAEDDLVRFVIQAVQRLPLSSFTVNPRVAATSRIYRPATAGLALLICCYANGIFSSRRIQGATYRDPAVAGRSLTGNTHPDHDRLCAFRRNNLEATAAAFVQVLELAKELKLLRLGVVSLDGTHIRASVPRLPQQECHLPARPTTAPTGGGAAGPGRGGRSKAGALAGAVPLLRQAGPAPKAVEEDR